MKRFVFVVVSLLLIALPAIAQSLQPGARVRFVENGRSFSGTITAIRPDSAPLLIVNPYGGMVWIPLREIRAIRALGRQQQLTLPWLFPRERSFELFEFSTLDGSRIVGADSQGVTFDIDAGANGVREGIGLDRLRLIEAEPGLGESDDRLPVR